jgi:hypothetical protein
MQIISILLLYQKSQTVSDLFGGAEKSQSAIGQLGLIIASLRYFFRMMVMPVFFLRKIIRKFGESKNLC